MIDRKKGKKVGGLRPNKINTHTDPGAPKAPDPEQPRESILPAGPAEVKDGEEGRRNGWTASGSWYIINGEFRIGSGGLERTIPTEPKEGDGAQTTEETKTKCENSSYMADVHPEDLEGSKVLGKGASGVVKLMHHKKTKKPYAVKVMTFGNILNKQMIEQEISALEMSSRYVVRAYTAYMKERSLHIVQEFMDLGSLEDVLKKCKTIPERCLAAIAEQVLTGLKQMHEGRLSKNAVDNPNSATKPTDGSKAHRIHRDLKPANLLVNSDGAVKIADFGIATTTNTVGKSTFVGTTTYMSPERIQGGRYGTASDVWSVGLLLCECAAGAYPFKNRSNFIDLLIDITSTEKVALPDHLSSTCKEFLWSCMRQKPDDRPSVRNLLAHPFLSPKLDLWSPETHSQFPEETREKMEIALLLVARGKLGPVTKMGSVTAEMVTKLIFPWMSSALPPRSVLKAWMEEVGLQANTGEEE